MKVRRIVTGFDGGRSVFVEDDTLEAPWLPGVGEVCTAWSADRPATYPAESYADPGAAGFFPLVGGVRCLISTLAPEGTPDAQHTHASASGVADVMEDDEPGMHTSDTTDFNLILEGRAILELDDGAEVEIAAGDLIVQNGTRHRWRNPYDAPMKIATFMVGAHRS